MKTIFAFFLIFVFVGFINAQEKTKDLTFHKEFLGNGVSISNSVVDFKSDGVFINNKRKGFYKAEGSAIFLLARYSDINQNIYVLVTDIAQGTCGYNTFTIVTIDELENVKVYETSPRFCSGETPLIKFYNSGKPAYSFLIDVGFGLRLNLTIGKWSIPGKK